MLTKEEEKEVLFYIFSAGFEKGYAQNIDLATAFNNFYTKILCMNKK